MGVEVVGGVGEEYGRADDAHCYGHDVGGVVGEVFGYGAADYDAYAQA